jgi:hypothetical protein
LSGVLNFTLGLESQGYVKGVKDADAATKGLISDTKLSGIQMGITSRAFTGGLHEITAGARGAKEATRALAEATEMLGFSFAPKLTMGARAAFEGLKAVHGLAETGLGFGPLGLAAAGVAAAVWTMVEGFQAVTASLEEMKTEDALSDQAEVLRGKLIPQLEKYMRLGRIDAKEGQGLINVLRDSAGNPDRERAAIANAQKALRPISVANAQAPFKEQLHGMMTGLSHQFLLDGAARDKAVFSDEQDKRLQEALELAKKAGLGEKETNDIVHKFNEATQAEYKRIDEKYSKKNSESPKRVFDLKNEALAGLERMGLVMRGGAGAGHDPASQTARNTKEMNEKLNKLVNIILRSQGQMPSWYYENAPAI